MTLKVWLATAAILAAMAGAEAKQDEPSAIKGLIVDRCADCHLVVGYEARAADVGAPSMNAIASERDIYTTDRLRASLRNPHWPMQQFILSPTDIDRIVAYIEDLRDEM